MCDLYRPSQKIMRGPQEEGLTMSENTGYLILVFDLCQHSGEHDNLPACNKWISMTSDRMAGLTWHDKCVLDILVDDVN